MKAWLLALLALVGPTPARAVDQAPLQAQEKEQILVIVHRSNPVEALSVEQVRNIFMRRDLTWERALADRKEGKTEEFDPREKILPIELTRSKEHRAFLAQVLQKDEDVLERHWIKLEYQHAIMRPKRVSTPDRVVKYTASLKGCIGFINAKDLDARAREHVKVVLTLGI